VDYQDGRLKIKVDVIKDEKGSYEYDLMMVSVNFF